MEIIPNASVAEQITLEEGRHLTDELRRQAISTLPQKNFAVLTRDNLIALIPPNEEEAECLAEGCAVDIGRAIAVEYISQGTVGKFGKRFTLLIELYETMGGKLLGSIVMESEDIDGLLYAIREQSPAVFRKILEYEGLSVSSDLASSPKIGTGIKSEGIKTSTWIALGFDIAGAALVGYGIYQNMQLGKLQKDYNTATDKSGYDFESGRKKVTDAESSRNIGYIASGILLASGISIHIFF